MPLSTIRNLWSLSLLLLALASYRWPSFGLFSTASTVVAAGLLNYLLTLRSSQFGLYSGGSASFLAVATGMGAQLNLPQIAASGLVALAVGFAFGALRVHTIDPDD